MDGGRQGRSRDAQAHVHPPGQSGHRGTVDAKGRLLPQAQADKQHLGQARICKCTTLFPSSIVLYLSHRRPRPPSNYNFTSMSPSPRLRIRPPILGHTHADQSTIGERRRRRHFVNSSSFATVLHTENLLSRPPALSLSLSQCVCSCVVFRDLYLDLSAAVAVEGNCFCPGTERETT